MPFSSVDLPEPFGPTTRGQRSRLDRAVEMMHGGMAGHSRASGSRKTRCGFIGAGAHAPARQAAQWPKTSSETSSTEKSAPAASAAIAADTLVLELAHRPAVAADDEARPMLGMARVRVVVRAWAHRSRRRRRSAPRSDAPARGSRASPARDRPAPAPSARRSARDRGCHRPKAAFPSGRGRKAPSCRSC